MIFDPTRRRLGGVLLTIGVLFLFTGGLVALTVDVADAASDDKVDVCHTPPR